MKDKPLTRAVDRLKIDFDSIIDQLTQEIERLEFLVEELEERNQELSDVLTGQSSR